MNTCCPELLAPAGTPEAAWAALAYGATAVYAGLPRFSARAEAGNFTPEALDELVGYAHSLGQRVYITLNTLIQQDELGDAFEALACVREVNADAVIVQDMGLARMARRSFPQLRLHASTQLAVHNLAGARQLAEAGFSRAVLARELGLNEIQHIAREGGIETEVFIHGALCYSYSGLCLLSSHLLGRSGNRGRCAYCCRQSFSSGDGHSSLPFSMRDFCAAAHVPQLLAAGVTALKIEGRMKGALYVAAVTDYYRRLVDGQLSKEQQTELLTDIQTIFGRPSTSLYLNGQDDSPVDSVHDGHRGAFLGTVEAVNGPWLILNSNRALQKHDGLKVGTADDPHPFGFGADEMRLATDPEGTRRFELPAAATIALRLPADAPRLAAGAAVYCSFSQAVRQRYSFTTPRPGHFRQRRPVDVHVSQSLTRTFLTARATAKGNPVAAELVLPGPFEAARQPEKAWAAVSQCFARLGDTDWQLDRLSFDEAGVPVFIPASVLNDARRRLIADLSSAWTQVQRERMRQGQAAAQESWCASGSPSSMAADACSPSSSPPPVWSVKTRIFAGLTDLDFLDEIVLEVDPSRPEQIAAVRAALAPGKLRLALPVIIRDADTTAYQALIASFPEQQKWEVANVGGLNLVRDRADLTADWPLYTVNVQAANHWHDLGIRQFVLSPEDDAENLLALIRQLGEAAIVPIYQHTPLMISATRPKAAGPELTDRSRRAFRVERAGREFVLVNEKPFSLVDHIEELQHQGARQFRIDLCYGTDAPGEAAALVQSIMSRHPGPTHEGNFSRGLQ